MYRKFFALFFSVLFMASLFVPAITLVVKGEADLLVLLDITEEENKEQEILKDAEIKFIEKEAISAFYKEDLKKETNHVYFFNHSEHYIGIHLPPPELI
ncbi:MAG: hypothetical protein COA67_06165 [Lutibacter sp.]|nr:MAG: hypothetical protein COA67_06165 [Lutibacter sp.]